ncbi:Acyltransferase family protein [Posidoniimonas polymericola]|uniref:Acyltransferase family protein n=1 Tax=Posidoniimonas polymericola TaxID=2528002 RepID=A0A5C5YII9_9BACT|nr:acyltransferase [Posidoniimonas polymericola]TWT74683.1 Acyltransferase family protein [Posidoniimonas polymericola]
MTKPNASSAAPSTGRILELDALRGLAAVAVVLFHFTTRFEALFGRATPLGWSVSLGEYGVDLFFMLSGFVILMTLERTTGWFSFVWGRFSRLYPAYWVAVGLTFAVVAWFGLPGQEVSPRDALLNVTMVQSLLGAEHVDGAYWSLQAEVIFYANMLLLFRSGVFRRPLTAVVAWVAVSVAALLISLGAEHGLLPAAAAHVTKLMTLGSLKYIPLFGVGILLYSLKQRRIDSLEAVLGVTLCLLADVLHHGVTAGVVGIGLAGLLAAAVHGRLPWLNQRGLVYLGALSYPLYLVHQNIGYVIMRSAEAAGIAPGLGVAAAVAVAVVLAAALHHLVEGPSLACLRGRRPHLSWLKLGNRQDAKPGGWVVPARPARESARLPTLIVGSRTAPSPLATWRLGGSLLYRASRCRPAGCNRSRVLAVRTPNVAPLRRPGLLC